MYSRSRNSLSMSSTSLRGEVSSSSRLKEARVSQGLGYRHEMNGCWCVHEFMLLILVLL